MTRAELKKMAEIDIRQVDPETLVDLNSVEVDQSLTGRKRVMDFIEQIGNPYCYKSNGMTIKISFNNDKRTLHDCVKDYIATDCVH